MRKSILTFLLILLITGCATNSLKVSNNKLSFYFENRLIKSIRVNNLYDYIGATKQTLPSGQKGKLHAFVKSNTEVITIFVFDPKTNSQFVKVNLSKNVLDNGTFESGGRSYFYYITKEADDRVCTLVKTIQVPIPNGPDVAIAYIEDLTPTGIDCNKWSNPWDLNKEQKKFLENFNSRSSDSIEMQY